MSNKYLGSLKCCLLSVALFIGLSASETFAVELNPNSELTLSYFTDTQSSGDDDDSSSDAVCPTGTYPVYSSGDDDSSSKDDSSSDDDSSSKDDSSSGDDDSKSEDDDSSSDDEDSNSGDDDSSSGDDDSKSGDDDSSSSDEDSKSEDDDSSSSDNDSSSKDDGSSDDDGSSRSFECVACTDVSAVFSFNSRNVVITGLNLKKVTLILADGSEEDFNINGSNLNNGVVKLPNNDEDTSQPIVSIRVTTKCNTNQTIDGPALGNPNYDG